MSLSQPRAGLGARCAHPPGVIWSSLVNSREQRKGWRTDTLASAWALAADQRKGLFKGALGTATVTRARPYRDSWLCPCVRALGICEHFKAHLPPTVKEIFMGQNAPPPSFHPQIDLCLPRPCPHSVHTPRNSCWNWVCVTWPPGGWQQGLEAVKSRPLQPRTAPPLSQSQRGKDLNLE